MRAAGTVRYHHTDPVSGLVESEYNHLFVGVVRAEPRFDPDEVAETVFADAAALERLRGQAEFSVWFPTVLDAVRPALRELAGSDW